MSQKLLIISYNEVEGFEAGLHTASDGSERSVMILKVNITEKNNRFITNREEIKSAIQEADVVVQYQSEAVVKLMEAEGLSLNKLVSLRCKCSSSSRGRTVECGGRESLGKMCRNFLDTGHICRKVEKIVVEEVI